MVNFCFPDTGVVVVAAVVALLGNRCEAPQDPSVQRMVQASVSGVLLVVEAGEDTLGWGHL